MDITLCAMNEFHYIHRENDEGEEHSPLQRRRCGDKSHRLIHDGQQGTRSFHYLRQQIRNKSSASLDVTQCKLVKFY
jgi:hypothetical protein